MSKKVEFKQIESQHRKEPHIALLLMCKNETKRIGVTLNSVVGYVNSLVIYDTGSTDDTIDIIRTFSEKHGIPLRLKEGVFENFSTSRNVSLDFADTFEDIDFLLLMDVNDELRGGEHLREFARNYLDNKKHTSFLVCQQWWSGQTTKYFNSRFVRPRTGWRYRGRVHEWLDNDMDEKDKNIIRVDENVILYQDRTLDDDKTGKRFKKDKVLLLEDFQEKPTDSRTVFYLAQTCLCLNEFDDAYYYYKLRTTLMGFYEERYEASLKCGDLTQQLKHDWSESMGWYIKAYEIIHRAEPLFQIAQYYKEKERWELAFAFADMACRLTYPNDCILFVNKRVYDYERWSLMGIIGWYSKRFDEGKAACLAALRHNPDSEVDKNNLKFYEEREKEIAQKSITKEGFIREKIQELARQNPKQTHSQLEGKAKMLWKLESRKK